MPRLNLCRTNLCKLNNTTNLLCVGMGFSAIGDQAASFTTQSSIRTKQSQNGNQITKATITRREPLVIAVVLGSKISTATRMVPVQEITWWLRLGTQVVIGTRG